MSPTLHLVAFSHTSRYALYFPAMSDTPFRDKAREVAEWLDDQHSWGTWYQHMERESGGAYSHAWWKKLVDNGPWDGDSGEGNTLPPKKGRLEGIAELFETSPEHVAQMIAADWYGVVFGVGVSDRAKELIPLIDRLSDEDASIAASLLREGVATRAMVLMRFFDRLGAEDVSFADKILRGSSGRARKLVQLIDELGDDDAALAEALILRLSGEKDE
jgi:hypothetical protein